MSNLTDSQVSQPISMEDEMITLLVAKVGLSQDEAEQVFEIAINYIKDHPYQLLSYVNRLRSSSESAGLGGFFN